MDSHQPTHQNDENDEDEIDGLKKFLSFKKDKPVDKLPKKKQNEPRSPSFIDSVNPLEKINETNIMYYPIKAEKRGLLLVFNHFKFDMQKYSNRNGTEIDCRKIEKTFRALQFLTNIYNDFKYGDIQQALKNAAQMDHSNYDCLVVVVMTHGDTNELAARDEMYRIENLWKPFAAIPNPTLDGKPKLFFIQACRGGEVDPGIDCQIEFDSVVNRTQSNLALMPPGPDYLFMYATPIGNYSFRSPNRGAWFIQALCDELGERAQDIDLLKILSFVNRLMAFDCMSNVPSCNTLDRKKQVGSIVHTLTRLIHFGQRT